MLIDTHAHLTMPEFLDLDAVLDRSRAAGVSLIINASFDIDSSNKSVLLSRQYDNLYSTVGIHPHHADRVDDATIDNLKKLCDGAKTVAVGETGLDYFENPVPSEIQKKSFAAHIALAGEKKLPLVLHGRSAEKDMLDVLSQEGAGSVGAVFHCFSSGPDYAKKVLDMGFMISFTGVVTFKNAHIARDTVKYVPIDRIMVETDCPYLAPQAMRGKRNEPSYIVHTARKIAEIKNLPFEDVCRATTANAMRFFNITKR